LRILFYIGSGAFVQKTLVDKWQMFLPSVSYRSLYWFVFWGFSRQGTTDVLPTHAPTAALLFAFQRFYESNLHINP
jgi:hypothetical protein